MEIKSAIESLLLVSDRPLAVGEIAGILECENAEAESALLKICVEYKERNGGIQIINNLNKYQMVSSGENSKIVRKFLELETTGELTRPQVEALTTIAYRGPITKAELEQVRGVNCSLVLRNLMMRGLVEINGEKNLEQKYAASLDFLKFLGVGSVKELPDYEKLNGHEVINQILSE